MIKKFFVTLIACSAFLVSCNNDDDNINNMPIESRNSLDDKAIEQYLNDYYFSPGDTINGKIVRGGTLTKFDSIPGNEDDKYPALKTLIKKDSNGILYAENPNHAGTGKDVVVSNDSTKIHISYNVLMFKATDDLTKANNPTQKYYGTFGTYVYPTYNIGDGSPVVDPSFYYFTPTEVEAKNGVKREHQELKNFIEGLKHFKPTERDLTDNYNFQGVIILPSRLAFARNQVYVGTGLSDLAYRDISFIFNFELVKTEKRTK